MLLGQLSPRDVLLHDQLTSNSHVGGHPSERFRGTPLDLATCMLHFLTTYNSRFHPVAGQYSWAHTTGGGERAHYGHTPISEDARAETAWSLVSAA